MSTGPPTKRETACLLPARHESPALSMKTFFGCPWAFLESAKHSCPIKRCLIQDAHLIVAAGVQSYTPFRFVHKAFRTEGTYK